MKKIAVILCVCTIMIGIFSCEDKPVEVTFEDQEQQTIYDYMLENEDMYSSFLSILQKGGIDKALSAYNPNGIGYTLFLPDNGAVDNFIEESDRFTSLEDLLNDEAYVYELSRYHVVNLGINSNDFPFGALPEYTLSGDLLTVNFVIETDTSYYKINNQAPVIRTNIEVSNGFIHLIGSTLKPITYTTYNWLEQHPGYSIFKAAVDATGLDETLNANIKLEQEGVRPFTLLLEHDTVFNKRSIESFGELANLISPGNSDYSNTSNPLYNFINYHLLTENRFLDDFVGAATNYTTYSEIPLNINGLGLDIKINMGKEIFDIIIHQSDTTVIDYIGFNYDASNILTQSGVIHFIDQILQQQNPSRAIQTFEFWEEPFLNELRLEPGTYLIEDSSSLTKVSWSGADLFFVETGDDQSSAWGGDYLYVDGDFSISYSIPKLVQGSYTVFLGAEAYNQLNALVEIYIDGKKVGGLVDLATGGSSAFPFARLELGTIDFLKYEEHTITISSLIPGRFSWDYIRFEPL
ncbi:MAG TPA: fasciclin domain-containing protein [Bacteroidales bacterium]|nr:fasciclin domain-containing protein [Bacteroidales bacterium]